MEKTLTRLVLGLSLIPLILLLLTFLFKTSPAQTCDTCPPPSACNINCNSTLSFRYTSTSEYFNFSIDEYTDIIVTLRINEDFPGKLTDYAIYGKLGSCPSESNYDWMVDSGSLSADEQKYLVNLPPGIYYINVTNVEEVDPNSYNLTIECGHYCGNGIVDNFGIISEQCDKNAGDASAPCFPYQYCNETCQCHDFRSEMTECNYYDYCVNGTNAEDPTEPCCEESPGITAQCCILSGQPSDCSDPNAIRNESVVAKWDYCATNYDITNVCIDADFRNHTWFTCPL
jgi:hypothetical protein